MSIIGIARVGTPHSMPGSCGGAYHFGDGSDVDAQVEHFIEVAQPDETTLMALDWEPNPNGSQMSLDQARRFLSVLGQKLGRRPVLYSGHLAKEKLGNSVWPFFGEHRLWLAQYSTHWTVQRSWDKYWLWQYRDDGEVPGIDGDVDLNAFDGTPEQLALEWAS